MARDPTAAELQRIVTYHDAQRAFLEKHPKAAETLGADTLDELTVVDVATWSLVARLLMNLDEFITRE